MTDGAGLQEAICGARQQGEPEILPPAPASQSLPHHGPFSPCYRNVLVVEDDPRLRLVLARNLASRGCRVREAASAEEALLALRADPPDLMLLDINLPDRTGWDVLRELTAAGQQ